VVRELGRYELIRRIAQGGMAEVYLARRRVAGVEKRLVIKRIRPERSADPRFLELFVREARLSMRLVHQNIVPVFDFGRAGDDVFLAMEHVDGRDLGTALARAGRLDPVVAAFVAAECCQALDYAHGRRTDEGTPMAVVHRDVTPRNVLLSWSGEVKLADFGVASVAGDTGVRGTLTYMAPEQARGELVDGRADVYALGLVLWEMLSGRRARAGGGERELLAAARRGEPPPALDDVPAPLAAAIARATAARADDRYPDARALLDDLDRFVVAERAAHPDQPAPARRLAEWLRGAHPALDEPTDALGAASPEAVATFLDDGEGGVLDATRRSIAETVAEAPPEPPPAPAPAPPPRPRRWPRLTVAVVAIGAVASAVAFAATRSAPSSTPRLAALPDAAAPAPPDAAAPRPIAVATPDAGSPPAPSPPAAPRRPRASAPPEPTPPAARHRVTLGATPWANFTVDGDPSLHQTPETLELAAGRHVIHFENPELRITRTVLLDVDRDLRHVEPMTPPIDAGPP